MTADVLIRGGRLYDPSLGLDRVGDIAVSGRKIVFVPEGEAVEARRSINAGGCIVLPGLIDVHTHINRFGTYIGMNPDIAGIPMGVTTMVDGGSTGVSNYRAFLHQLDGYETKSRIALNVCAGGQIMSTQYTENVDPKVWEYGLFKEAFEEFPDKIVGLKIRTSRNIVGELGMEPLKKAVELADRLGTRLYVHTTNPPCTMAELTAMLRPGDVVCHTFHGVGNTLLEDGHVAPGILEARRRGVIFDVSQGQGNFCIPVAQTCIAEGFYPDTVSTDLNRDSWNNPLAYSLLMTMSKLLAMGLPFDRLVDGVTRAPAALIGAEGEMGTLREGSCADITVVRLTERAVHFIDKHGNSLDADRLLMPMATIIDGQIQYRSPDTL